jgi:hypothetical protein
MESISSSEVPNVSFIQQVEKTFTNYLLNSLGPNDIREVKRA